MIDDVKTFAAISSVNAPNVMTATILTASDLQPWMGVLLAATSIICTILVTRHQLRK